MSSFIDMTGQRYGNLLVLSQVANKCDKVSWLCVCDCGNRIETMANSLRQNKTVSCGCKEKRPMSAPGVSGFNYLFFIYKRNAKKRNLCFELTRDEFEKLTKQDCFYCAENPKQVTKRNRKNSRAEINSRYVYNGIDRKNNNIGYTIENCAPCCGNCNYAKRTQNYADFKNWITKVDKNLNKPQRDRN